MSDLNQLPKISIVVPSFNQGNFLNETLTSIFAQNYPHLEVVVIDGGSTDNSVEVIKSWEQSLSYWHSERDNGQSNAINQGMRHCSGEIVAWLNSDDFYWKDSLWTVGRAYRQYPDHGLYVGNGFRYKESGKLYKSFCPHHVAFNRQALTYGLDYILQPSTFFLRQAWEAVGGLNEELHYAMDWDILIRISQRYPVVTINEFLSVSREHDETKTNTGKLRRIAEIFEMIQRHSDVEMTPGTLFYALETLSSLKTAEPLDDVRDHLWQAMKNIMQGFHHQYGEGLESFPADSDPGDNSFIPQANSKNSWSMRPRTLSVDSLPSISIVVPSYNQDNFLSETLDSIFSQNYPNLEVFVVDGGSTDNSVEIIKSFENLQMRWVSEPDEGPANAINRGFRQVSGDVVAWLNSDDTYAIDTLWEVAEEFARDSELDMVIGNALYVDEKHLLHLAHHGTHRTGLYYGKLEPYARIPAYWEYVHSVPQPTVFFRRRLLDRFGGQLDESFKYIFDFELFFRFAANAKIKKIERTTAFYRIHTKSKTGGDWTNFLIELYRFSRPHWMPVWSAEFKGTLRSYLSTYMKRNYGTGKRNWRFWLIAVVVACMVVTRIGNPEALIRKRRKAGKPMPVTALPNTPPAHLYNFRDLPKELIEIGDTSFSVFFCSLLLPQYPGYSGGEIRDFHLVRHLLKFSKVRFFALYSDTDSARTSLLFPYLEEFHTAETPYLYQQIISRKKHFQNSKATYHNEANTHAVRTSYIVDRLQQLLREQQPNFLFVSPQSNPIGLMLSKQDLKTRFILASYDVEAIRVARLTSAKGDHRSESERAEIFERDNLKAYDGVIAVSILDKQAFINKYRYPAERILVVENSVDLDYFRFRPRDQHNQKNIVYVGSLSYFPNEQAAWRLIERIMPLVRLKYPDVCLWIVGQGASQKLSAIGDNEKVIVSGKVDDVRPYLAYANLTCIPLLTGSGTKYKVLEAFSAGVPVVCSPIAAEGLDVIPGLHALVGETDQEIADHILYLLDNPHVADQIAVQARELVTVNYAWESNLSKIDKWLEQIEAMPHYGLTSGSSD